MFSFLASHEEGMISMQKKNTVADVPLQEHSTKNNFITYYLRINSIVTGAVYPALSWPGLGFQPVTHFDDVGSTADVFLT